MEPQAFEQGWELRSGRAGWLYEVALWVFSLSSPHTGYRSREVGDETIQLETRGLLGDRVGTRARLGIGPGKPYLTTRAVASLGAAGSKNLGWNVSSERLINIGFCSLYG